MSFYVYDAIHGIVQIVVEKLSVAKGIEVQKVFYALSEESAIHQIEEIL